MAINKRKLRKLKRQLAQNYRINYRTVLIIIFIIFTVTLFIYHLVSVNNDSKPLLVRSFINNQNDQDSIKNIKREVLLLGEILTTHPDYRDGWYRLAVLLWRLGNDQEAKVAIERLLKIDPNYELPNQFLKYQLE